MICALVEAQEYINCLLELAVSSLENAIMNAYYICFQTDTVNKMSYFIKTFAYCVTVIILKY